MATPKNVNVKNKKAEHLYELVEEFTAGLQLWGTEIKSLRNGKASLNDSYCFFKDNELWVKMHISEYDFGGYVNHEAKRSRKLLLTRRELDKLHNKVQQKGMTVVPLVLYISESGWAKLDVALAKGKRKYDKRESLKEKDNKRQLDRVMKAYK